MLRIISMNAIRLKGYGVTHPYKTSLYNTPTIFYKQAVELHFKVGGNSKPHAYTLWRTLFHMRRAHLKYGIDIGLLITFILCFFTGIVKFPALLDFNWLTRHVIRFKYVTLVHDWSGVAMGILVLAHLVLNWGWIMAMTRQLVKEKNV
jgi:hypothetical protein